MSMKKFYIYYRVTKIIVGDMIYRKDEDQKWYIYSTSHSTNNVKKWNETNDPHMDDMFNIKIERITEKDAFVECL